MRNDPVVEEIRKLRDEYAAQHGHDVHRIAEDLRQWEKTGLPLALAAVHEPDPLRYSLPPQNDTTR